MSLELSNGRRVVWNWSNFLSEDTRPRVIDTVTGDVICELIGHTDYIRHGLELRDGRLLTWSNDQTLRVWRLTDGVCELILDGHEDYVNYACEVSGDRIISSSGDKTVRVWSLKDGAQLHCMAPGDLHSSLEISLVLNGWLAARAGGVIYLYDIDDGGLIETIDSEEQYCDVLHFDEEHFLCVTNDFATVYAYCDGREVSHVPLKGYLSGVGALPEQQLITWHWNRYRTKKLFFELWAPLQQQCLGSYECSGEEVLAIKDLGNGHVAVSCSDYRLLVFQKAPFRLSRIADFPADRNGNFLIYNPSDLTHLTAENSTLPKPAVGGEMKGRNGLHSRLLRFSEASSVRLKGLSWDYYGSGMVLSDGRVALNAEDGWFQLWDFPSNTSERLSPAAMQVTHPEYFDIMRKAACHNGDRDSIAERFAELHGVSKAEISESIAALDGEGRNDAVACRPTESGAILIWRPATSEIWMLSSNIGGRSFTTSLLNGADGNLSLVNGAPVIAPDGDVYLWNGKGFEQLSDGDAPIRVAPGVRDHIQSVRWCSKDRIVIRHGSGVNVRDAKSGELVTHLDGGHGVGNWGFVELQDGKLVTWTRTSLRSWAAETYEPIVELRDPVDWGPGREFVCPLKSGGVAFSVGPYSGDSRVVIWDGAHEIVVYNGHRGEVSRLVELSDGAYLTYEDSSDGDIVYWRNPVALRS